jgi:hypothetical protein
MNVITLLGISLILFYTITQILTFYGVGVEVYGIYFLFYVFLIVSIIILPNSYPKV